MSRHAKLTLFTSNCHNVFDVTLTDNLQYHGQSVDTENIRWIENCETTHKGYLNNQGLG